MSILLFTPQGFEFVLAKVDHAFAFSGCNFLNEKILKIPYLNLLQSLNFEN